MSAQPANGAVPTLSTVNPVFRDAILAETIKKELWRHKLYENYMLTPEVAKSIVVTNKPNESSVQKLNEGVEDEEYKQLLRKLSLTPSQKYVLPVTSAQSYGWDTHPLCPEHRMDRRFYRPKVETEVTKMYGASIGGRGSKKGDKEEKKAA
ncbi:hypothetical protein HK104_005318 [Borealophlyctis nickersoniae]|nr:hypothetical protein HK104_005318 [Borealophlyctis nickersoniae]